MTGGELKELEALERDARAADQARPEPDKPAGGASAIAADPGELEVQGWAELPKMLGELVTPALPEMEAVYTAERCTKWGRAMLPIAKKYGWTPDMFLAWLGPWVGLGMATHQLITPLALAIAKKIEARQKKAAANDEQPAPAA
jgi:hypothetical protein